LSFISLLANQPFVVTVHPLLPVNSVKELIAAAKSKPGAIRYGSGGNGTAVHLGTELLQLTAGISMLHVPYKGSGPALTALMGGEVQVLINGIAAMLPQRNSGRFKMLAVTGAKRSQAAPDLPTVAEAGVPGFEFDVWYGMVFPGGTPRAIVSKVNADIVKVLKSPALTQRFSAAGVEPLGSTAQEFTDLIKRDSPKWQRVVKAANITIE
jgi:tripartite-type tricarboxylate transporter receptor subunit TctC